MILLYSGAAKSIMSKIENFIQECDYVARIGSTFDPADLKKKSVGCLSGMERPPNRYCDITPTACARREST